MTIFFGMSVVQNRVHRSPDQTSICQTPLRYVSIIASGKFNFHDFVFQLVLIDFFSANVFIVAASYIALLQQPVNLWKDVVKIGCPVKRSLGAPSALSLLHEPFSEPFYLIRLGSVGSSNILVSPTLISYSFRPCLNCSLVKLYPPFPSFSRCPFKSYRYF